MFECEELNTTCAGPVLDRKMWKDFVQDWELMNNENNVDKHKDSSALTEHLSHFYVFLQLPVRKAPQPSPFGRELLGACP